MNSCDENALPAVLGGRPTLPAGPPDWPLADPEVLEAMQQSFADGSWGRYHGPHCRLLAEQLAEFHGVPFVLLCCSGTFAVELALRAAGIGPGDEVILAGYDFPGNFRGIEAIGARPVLVDVAADNWNLDPRLLPEAVSPKTKAVLVSHLHGGVVAMKAVRQWAAQHGVAVVEDACQCPGATIEGRVAGASGDVGVISFGGSKLLSAGRGGAIFTSNESLYQRAKIFGQRGNEAFPLSELQAAVLVPQLARLAQRNAQRQRAVETLGRQLSDLAGLRLLDNGSTPCEPAYYKLGWQFDSERHGATSRNDFAAAVRAEGVAFDAGFRGFSLRSAHRCRVAGELVQSRLASDGMCVLHHPVLLESEETLGRVARAILKISRWTAAGQSLRSETPSMPDA